MTGAVDRIERLLETSTLARYGGAAGLVLVTVAVRFLLDAMMVGGLGMAFFYPAVILSAYWMGARPAILTAVLSTIAVLAFQAFSTGSLVLSSISWVILILFIVTSALAIYLISAIRQRLRALAARHDRTEALVLSQASLFRDHAERVTNHLQLIAAILEFRADGESQPEAVRVLTNAASRTLLISRMHREFAGDPDRTIDFAAFARRLAEASDPDRPVAVHGDGLELPLEQATSLGLVLLDRLNASRGPVAIDLQRDEDDIAFSLALEEGTLPSAARDLMLLDAVSIQLRGRLDLDQEDGLTLVRLTFPAALQPPPSWAPLEQAIH